MGEVLQKLAEGRRAQVGGSLRGSSQRKCARGASDGVNPQKTERESSASTVERRKEKDEGRRRKMGEGEESCRECCGANGL